MVTNILHITDLHIKDPESQSEKLRSGFYKDYLLSLQKIISKTVEKIDIIACTGDIIDKAKTSNFSHASIIFEELKHLFKIPANNIFICPGNHDFKVVGTNDLDNSEYEKFFAHFNK